MLKWPLIKRCSHINKNEDLKQNLEARVASAAARVAADSTAKVAAEKATNLPGGQEEATPTLPTSNNNFNS